MYTYETRKLSFQLVPAKSWYKNLHNFTPRWNEISEKIREKNICEICGKETRVLDAHEVWIYDDVTHTQSLDKIIAVCKDCRDSPTGDLRRPGLRETNSVSHGKHIRLSPVTENTCN